MTERSPAYQRFKASMEIDYDKWKEGEPFDIPALKEITPEERDLLVDELLAVKLDWREIEALRALGTPRALAHISKVAEEKGGAAGAEALVIEVETKGWSSKTEDQLIRQLAELRSMQSSSDRLYGLCEAHPTPAVMERLMDNAKTQGDPTMRYSAGAVLLYLTGHAEERYGWHKDHRPHLLALNSDDYKTYKAAVAWLQEKVANPKKHA